MVNLDELLQNEPVPGRLPCKLSIWLTTLNEDDAAAVHRALANDTISARHIYRTIKTVGYPGGETTIRNHRRGECQTCQTE